MYFTAWRAWGHYQGVSFYDTSAVSPSADSILCSAFNAAQFLSTLPVTTKSSPELDTIFSATASTSQPSASHNDAPTTATSLSGSATTSPESDGLLTLERAAALTKLYVLPPHVHTELLRAISQATKRGT